MSIPDDQKNPLILFLPLVHKLAGTWLYIHLAGPIDNPYQLAEGLGISYSTARSHIVQLQAAGLITPNFPILSTELSTTLVDNLVNHSRKTRETTRDNRESLAKNASNQADSSDPSYLINTIITTTNINKDSNNNNNTREKRESPECWAAFQHYGIVKNSRTIALVNQGLTPELIHAWAKELDKPYPKYSGLLINTLESVMSNGKQHPSSCNCTACQDDRRRRRYASAIATARE